MRVLFGSGQLLAATFWVAVGFVLVYGCLVLWEAYAGLWGAARGFCPFSSALVAFSSLAGSGVPLPCFLTLFGFYSRPIPRSLP